MNSRVLITSNLCLKWLQGVMPWLMLLVWRLGFNQRFVVGEVPKSQVFLRILRSSDQYSSITLSFIHLSPAIHELNK